MQGTIAMLMALSGLGCHHKSCAPVVVESCYTSCHSSCYSSCYASPQVVSDVVIPASQCYSSCYATTTYSSCYSSCYNSNSCYSSCYSNGHGHARKGHGLFGGLFHHKRRAAACDTCNLGVVDACYSTPVYGSYTPAYVTSYPSSQGVIYGAPQGTMAPPATAVDTTVPPPAPVPAVAPAPAPAPVEPAPAPKPETVITPPPAPAPAPAVEKPVVPAVPAVPTPAETPKF